MGSRNLHRLLKPAHGTGTLITGQNVLHSCTLALHSQAIPATGLGCQTGLHSPSGAGDLASLSLAPAAHSVLPCSSPTCWLAPAGSESSGRHALAVTIWDCNLLAHESLSSQAGTQSAAVWNISMTLDDVRAKAAPGHQKHAIQAETAEQEG